MTKTFKRVYEIKATMHKLGTLNDTEERTFRVRANSRQQALNKFYHAWGEKEIVQCKVVADDIEFASWSGFDSGKVLDVAKAI